MPAQEFPVKRWIVLRVVRNTSRFAIAVFLIAIAIGMCGCGSNQSAAQQTEQKVKSIISIGMSKNDVVDALNRAGIKHSPMVQPVKDGDYFEIHVTIDSDRGAAETAEYVITGGGQFFGKNAFVVITLDNNEIVTSIE